MEKPTIGLSQRFQPAAAAAGTATVLSSTSGGGKGKGMFNNLDWKVKMAVLLLVAALLYFTVVRYMKKKGNTCSGQVKGKGGDAASGNGDEKADKSGEKS